MKKQSLAEQAKLYLQENDIVPNLGQAITDDPNDAGCLHCFPDGSVGMHWDDGGFDVGEPTEED